MYVSIDHKSGAPSYSPRPYPKGGESRRKGSSCDPKSSAPFASLHLLTIIRSSHRHAHARPLLHDDASAIPAPRLARGTIYRLPAWTVRRRHHVLGMAHTTIICAVVFLAARRVEPRLLVLLIVWRQMIPSRHGRHHHTRRRLSRPCSACRIRLMRGRLTVNVGDGRDGRNIGWRLRRRQFLCLAGGQTFLGPRRRRSSVPNAGRVGRMISLTAARSRVRRRLSRGSHRGRGGGGQLVRPDRESAVLGLGRRDWPGQRLTVRSIAIGCIQTRLWVSCASPS